MPQQSAKKAIIVLGMHRSGTSAVTRVLNLLGVELGNNLMPPYRGNEKGFWEHLGIVSLHDQILARFDSRWDDPAPLPDGWWKDSTVQVLKGRILDVLRRDFSASPLWGLKDPRMCRLLPLWEQIFSELGCEPFYVIMLRNPEEVAASLEKRDGLSGQKSDVLWLDHTIAVESGTRGRPRVFIAYDQLLSDWEKTMTRVSTRLDVNWPRSYADAAPAVAEFLEPNLKHHHANDARLLENPQVHAWVKDIYRETKNATQAGPEQAFENQLAETHAQYRAALDLFGPVLKESEKKTAAATAQLQELDLQLQKKELQIAEQQRDLGSANQEKAALAQEIAASIQLLAAKELRLAAAEQTHAALQTSLASIQAQLSSRDQRLADLELNGRDVASQLTALHSRLKASEQEAAHKETRITSLSLAVTERDGQIANMRDDASRAAAEKDREISAARQELDHLLHSRSWRATAPLRKAAAAVQQAVRPPHMPFKGSIIESFLKIRRRLARESAVRRLRDSSLFDSNYYLAKNPDVRDAELDPARHYLLHGWEERRDPSAAFSTSQYLSDNPDVARAQVNPLIHYLRHGRQEGRALPSEKGSGEAVSSADPANAALDAEVEAIEKSGLFDESFYFSMYPDLRLTLAPGAGIRHYCERGWREGKNPSADFDTRSYLATYSDIRDAGLNPFWHYVVAGAAELRHADPDSTTHHEDDVRFGVLNPDVKLLALYSSPDWAMLRRRRLAAQAHSQPLLPHEDLGFYDPLDWRVLEKQAQLAKRHGLHGFCFHLGAVSPRPLDLFLAHHDIDFCFCVQMDLNSEDVPEPLIASVVRAASDKRCVRVEGRPVVLVALPGEKQHAARALRRLRRQFADHGVGGVFLIARQERPGKDGPEEFARLCDAVLDLPSAPVPGETGPFVPLDKNGADVVPYGIVASQGVARAQNKRLSSRPLYHAVTLGRDDAALSPKRPLVYSRFHARDYRRWLDAAIAGTRPYPADRRFVFVNAWNDWTAGLFLEPDRQGGFSRLNETTRALLGAASGAPMPKVSVIVPSYNHERFLRRRLDSVYGQTYKNIEVLLLDDRSSDASRSVLDQYAAEHPEITRTLYNDENSGGPFRQWAKGIKAATGDLVWIAESDDFCDERFLEVLVRCFDDEAVMLAYSKCVFVASDDTPMDGFQIHVGDLECAEKWNASYVETAHNEVRSALGIKNTVPNASGALFKRPIDMRLLDDESWLSMTVAGDWMFYLNVIRGGKIAYSTGTTNFFRRYAGSTAETAYKKEVFYRELSAASRTVQALYDVPPTVLEQSQRSFKALYDHHVGGSEEQFSLWYDRPAILQAREKRQPNVMVSTMGFYPGGAEILPIRLANEFKRQGLSVLLLSAGMNPREDRVRRMLRNDVPLIETPDAAAVKTIIRDFGVEVLNTHQWHIQKYPLRVSDVFDGLGAHVASLHGMIEHGNAFGVTEDELRAADRNVTTWVYTAEKNLGPFSNFGLYDKSSARFVKIPNGLQPPNALPVPRSHMEIPEDAFALCCVSRAIPDKGWAETILAVERARALSGRDIRLILVGNGPVHDEYCRVGVPSFVYLAGFSENSVGHYAAADMGIMLTKFKSESFPLTIVDCLFAGKPYIATDIGDIKNILTTADGVAGEVIELSNWEIPIEKAARSIASFATDSQKHSNALALVKDAADRYRIDAVASQYIRLFEDGRAARRIRSHDQYARK
jgi:glycosyltransferase involved in cell wall biosynthesis